MCKLLRAKQLVSALATVHAPGPTSQSNMLGATGFVYPIIAKGGAHPP